MLYVLVLQGSEKPAWQAGFINKPAFLPVFCRFIKVFLNREKFTFNSFFGYKS